ncbi:MAG: MFS transporter [Gammaproteobacteria bacterium]|nr:MFS transporter [Gammaproteobacteria bacterium]
MKPGSWSSIASIFLFGVLGASTVSKLVPLGADIAARFGTSAADFGWLISLLGFTALVLAIPSGLLVDRFGPRRVFTASVLLGMAANLIYYFAPAYTWMQAARLVEGVAIAHLYTAAPAFLMGTSEGPRRATAMTIWASYMPVGTAVGLLLAGYFAGGPQWRQTFLVHGALFAAVGLLNLRQPTLASSDAARLPGLVERLRGLRLAYSRPPLLLLAMAFFLMISVGFGANTTFPGYLARLHELPVNVTANAIALGTLLMVPGSLGVGALLARGVRIGPVFTVLGVLGAASGALAFQSGLDVPARMAVVAVWFVVSGASLAALMATLPRVAEPERRGAAAALMNQAGASATFLNPPLWLSLAAAGRGLPFAILMVGAWLVAVALIWGVTGTEAGKPK